jgi:hypothetical protein
MGPTGGLWKDLPAYNAYVTRCQSILQSGAPDNDILLYFPMDDLWHTDEGMLMTLTIHNQDKWLWPSKFYETAMAFWEKGYLADYASDALLTTARAVDGRVVVANSRYRVVVVPPCRLMPLETLEKLIALARQGAAVLFVDALPQDVPGIYDLAARRIAFQKLLREITPDPQDDTVRQRSIGSGRIFVGDKTGLLEAVSLPREAAADNGVRILRRTHAAGHHYFIAHLGDTPLDGWVPLGRNARSTVILDPMVQNRSGVAAVRQNAQGQTEVYLRMQPGPNPCFTTLPTPSPTAEMSNTDRRRAAGITGTWKLTLSQAARYCPNPLKQKHWPAGQHASTPTKRFAGTARYTIVFDAPAGADECG